MQLQLAFFSVKEFMDFTSKIIVERTAVCSRSSVKEQGIEKNIYFIY